VTQPEIINAGGRDVEGVEGVGCEEGCGEVMLFPRTFLEFHSGRGYILEHFYALLNRHL